MKMPRRIIILLITFAIIFVSAAPVVAQQPPEIGGCQMFPYDNIWNTPIDSLPLDPNSEQYINSIGANTNLHPDFGTVWQGNPIGIPYVVVPQNQPLVEIDFLYDDESDPGPYPIPPNPPIEAGSDRHILIVRQGDCKLFEVFAAEDNGDGTWFGGSGAVFDLNSNALRPDGWTSADAAGLPILPGLVRYEEVVQDGEINHAIRFTAAQTRRAYVWPARHFASNLTGPQYPPMGQRFRLKADFDISGFHPQVQVILTAMKTYGLILADNGSNWYISGVPDSRWDDDILGEIKQIPGSAFEAVDASSLIINPDSGQAAGHPPLFALEVAPASQTVAPGGVATYTISASGTYTGVVNLQTSPPQPTLAITLSNGSLVIPNTVQLTLKDNHQGSTLLPGIAYRVAITGTAGSLTDTAQVTLLVGGSRLYLPLVIK